MESSCCTDVKSLRNTNAGNQNGTTGHNHQNNAVKFNRRNSNSRTTTRPTGTLERKQPATLIFRPRAIHKPRPGKSERREIRHQPCKCNDDERLPHACVSCRLPLPNNLQVFAATFLPCPAPPITSHLGTFSQRESRGEWMHLLRLQQPWTNAVPSFGHFPTPTQNGAGVLSLDSL